VGAVAGGHRGGGGRGGGRSAGMKNRQAGIEQNMRDVAARAA